MKVSHAVAFFGVIGDANCFGLGIVLRHESRSRDCNRLITHVSRAGRTIHPFTSTLLYCPSRYLLTARKCRLPVASIMEAIKEAWKSITWTKKNIQDLHGLTIMVTGATDGVGFECARAYAEHGAHVIVHGRNKEKGDECALIVHLLICRTFSTIAAISRVACFGRRAVAEIKKTASQNAKVELMLCDLSVLQ